MAFIDGESYSHENIQDTLRELRGLLFADGQRYGDQVIYYFNIFLGGEFLKFESAEHKFHVYRYREFGHQFAIFHQIPRNYVLQTDIDVLDTCITILWTAKEVAVDQIMSGVLLADEIIRNIELITGKAFPVPLGPLQIPTPFEIAQFVVGESTIRKIRSDEKGELLPKFNDAVAQALYALQGFDKDYNELMERSPYSVIKVAARWQQKAIRARGSSEWSDCIVASSIWAEVFVVQMTVGINEVVGEPIVDLRKALSRGLPRFITTYLGSKHLKGRWDHTDKDTPFGRWYQECQEVRNTVVHTGKLPDEADAHGAYDAAHQFVKFLTVEIARLKDPRLDDYLTALRGISDLILGKKPKPKSVS
jgi:hypothetical protein